MRLPRVLLVDDDDAVRLYLSQLLDEEGYRVDMATNGIEAILEIEKELPDLVLSDLRMPEMDGLELVVHVKERWPELPVILLSVVDDVPAVVEAVQRGAVNYLAKSISPAVLLAAVKKAIRSRAVGATLPENVPEIIGRTRGMIEVRRLVTLASSSDVNVFVTGESGTGKGLVARAIHRRSGRSAGPLVTHNCATTPDELFESHFFGEGEDSPGDVGHCAGLLEQADGADILLDDLGTLSLRAQARLLRVLDTGEILPVGASRGRHVSVRFFASTTENPRELIDRGRLREDLYYRLGGIEIRLPPLRERPEDIPLLAQEFLGPGGGHLSPPVLEALRKYPWPGNVRELRNALESALALVGTGEGIQLRHLSLDPRAGGNGAARTMKDAERQAIVDALRAHNGNRSQAAQTLGIDRSTLRRKMQQLRIGVKQGPAPGGSASQVNER